MNKWTYRVETKRVDGETSMRGGATPDRQLQSWLDDLGGQGWELVSFWADTSIAYRAVLKRPLEQHGKRPPAPVKKKRPVVTKRRAVEGRA